MSDESIPVAAVELPRVVPVISNGHTADGRRRLCFGQWQREERAAEAAESVAPSTILEDLAGERLCAGEIGHLRWLLERAAAHGQVELKEGRRVMVNAVESASVRLGVLVVRLRSDAGQNHEGVEACGAEGPVVGLDEALRHVGVAEARPGLLLPDGEEVDDVRAAGETGPETVFVGSRFLIGLLVGCGLGWVVWLAR